MDINIKNIDEELWQETRATAIRDRKTMRDVLSEALRMWLEARNTKRGTLIERGQRCQK